MFLTSIIKIDREEYLDYNLSIFVCFSCFQFFQENHCYPVKVNNFGSCPLFDPLDQANLICF